MFVDRQKSGFWGFRSDKVETIHGYESKVEVSLSLSRTHTHTHTHTLSLSLSHLPNT